MSPFPLFNIVLVKPEIPSNTGNIGRTCVGSHSKLHLVEPLGFELTDKQLKRAGLDYWPHLQYKIYSDWQKLKKCFPSEDRVFYFSTKGSASFYDSSFQPGDWFVFGSESKGLASIFSDMGLPPPPLSQILKIPMPGSIRSLNLANAVSITIYEAFRQVMVLKK